MFLVGENINSHKEALVSEDGQRVTYQMLKKDYEQFAENMPTRCCVIILADNTIETIRFYYAAMSAKTVPLLLDEGIADEHLMEYCSLYHPQYIWACNQRYNGLEDVGDIVYNRNDHILVHTKWSIYPIFPELALLLTTSGSTGNPKVVRLSYRNLEENAYALIDAIGLEENARGVTTLPMNYTYGMAICHIHLLAGATLLVSNLKVYDPLFQSFIRKEEITNIHGVPFIHEMLFRIGFYDSIPESLTLVTMGGSKANVAFHMKMNETLAKKNIRFYALYGQTEGTTVLTKLPKNMSMNTPDCIGVACYGMQAMIDPDNQELLFAGNSVCMGYASRAEDLRLGDENNGLLRTGDLARIDEEGRIYLTGRVRRIVKIAGVRINIDDIEKMVSQQFPNVLCACSGKDNDIHIFVVGDIDTTMLQREIARQLHISHLVIKIVIVQEIPQNANGKTDYNKLETMFATNNLQ